MSQESFESARISLVGNRKMNQDRSAIFSQGPTTLMVIGDGLGGHPRGEVAAQLLMDICESMFRQEEKPLRDPEQFMARCLHNAHAAVVGFGDRQNPPICPRTTAVMAVVQGGVAYWAHVGDSRLYLVRNSHILAQTKDHSRVRYIHASAGASSGIRSNITRCLGGEEPPTITSSTPVELQTGDTLMLCSDGLWSQVPREQLLRALAAPEDFAAAIQALANEAVHQGYPRSDNVTILAIRWRPPARDHANTGSQGEDHLDAAVRHLEQLLELSKTS